MNCKQEYERWLSLAVGDEDIQNELQKMSESEIKDAFYRDLSFGTGGLRGVIGAGTNRMNIYTVAKASHNPAKYNGYKVYNSDGCQIRNQSEIG